MQTIEQTSRRQAIEDAIRGVLPEERTAEALRIWERECSGDSVFAARLVDLLDARMGLGDSRGQVFHRLLEVEADGTTAKVEKSTSGPPSSMSPMSPADVRQTLERLVTEQIAPIAQWYEYGEGGLRLPNWKPIVLFIGNYSSGKSTLINELLGGPIQLTGQAPTDDSFTVLVSADDARADQLVKVVEEIPGSTLVNDPSMPFGDFKSFGSRFLAHFRMKKVSTPHLRHVAVIDSPGMLDSVTEQDRGYDYQNAIGRMAELADLVVLMFDPHKAGTVKETYVSIRSTLPEATSEDRVVFVMNRVDECKNLTELTRCYGVHCWNLSQMTGRKDIPRVYLTYSPTESPREHALTELAGERGALLEKIQQAPHLQTNHLLGTVDQHLHKLEMLARTMDRAARRHFDGCRRYLTWSLIGSVVGGLAVDQAVAALLQAPRESLLGRLLTANLTAQAFILPVVAAGVLFLAAWAYFRARWLPDLRKKLVADIAQEVPAETQYQRDLWESVRPLCQRLLSQPRQLWWLTRHRGYAQRLRTLIDRDLKNLFASHLRQNPPAPAARAGETG